MPSRSIPLSAWFIAARPKSLTASIIPVSVATLLAFAVKGQVDAWLSLWALLVAIFIQIGTNFVNDALDFKKGADTHARLGPKRLVQAGLASATTVLRAGFLCFAFALASGIPLVMAGGWPFLALLLISVLLGYLYTGGPYPLAYVGLGELFVILFFGFISTVAVFFLQTGAVSLSALVAGLQVGSLATVLIAINNLRDIEGDGKAHKRTLAVRFGRKFARREIAFFTLLPFVLGLYWAFIGNNLAALLPLFALPLAGHIVRFIWTTEPSEKYNSIFAKSGLLQLLFGIFLCIAFWLQ